MIESKICECESMAWFITHALGEWGGARLIHAMRVLPSSRQHWCNNTKSNVALHCLRCWRSAFFVLASISIHEWWMGQKKNKQESEMHKSWPMLKFFSLRFCSSWWSSLPFLFLFAKVNEAITYWIKSVSDSVLVSICSLRSGTARFVRLRIEKQRASCAVVRFSYVWLFLWCSSVRH